MAPGRTTAPSMWLKARIWAPASTLAPGPNTTYGSITTPPAISVSQDKCTVSGALMDTPSAIRMRRLWAWNAASVNP